MGSKRRFFFRGLLVIAGISMLLALLPVGAGAWSNGGYSSDISHPDYGTHDWIADAALGLQTRNVTFMSSTFHSDFLLGTEAPDNPSYIGDTTKHHVYYRSSGAMQDDSSALRAREMYRTALEKMRAGNEKEAAFYAGAMTHYIADMGVFGHTMGSGTDWGSEAVHQDYEDAMNSAITHMAFPASLPLLDNDSYNVTIGLAYKVTFGSGIVKPNIWMDDNYDWTDPTYRSIAFSTVNETVSSVAAAVNHLVAEAGYAEPTPPAQDDTPSPDEPAHTSSGSVWWTAGVVAAVAAVTATAIMVARVFRRR